MHNDITSFGKLKQTNIHLEKVYVLGLEFLDTCFTTNVNVILDLIFLLLKHNHKSSSFTVALYCIGVVASFRGGYIKKKRGTYNQKYLRGQTLSRGK